jgi:hypothetical protein
MLKYIRNSGTRLDCAGISWGLNPGAEKLHLFLKTLRMNERGDCSINAAER